MLDLRISSAAARRISRLANRLKRSPQMVLDSALASGLDYEEWFQRKVAKGLAEIGDGKAIAHQELLRLLR